MRSGGDRAFGPPPDRNGVWAAIRLSVALAVSAFFLGALLVDVAPTEILDALAQFRPAWLPVVVAGIASSFALRAQRWAIMLRRAGSTVRFRDAAVPLMGSLALNNLLPFRTGDTIRLIAMQSFAGRVSSQQLGTLTMEKLLDLSALITIGVATCLVWPVKDPELIWALGMLAAALVAGVVLLGAAAPGVRFAVRGAERLSLVAPPGGHALLALFEATRSLSRPVLLARLAGYTLAAWVAEAVAAFAVAKALGLAHPLPTAALTIGLAGLSRFLPSLPGNIGVFDYFAATAASEIGTARAAAVAYALLLHVLVWIPATATGWLLLIGAARIGVTRGPSVRPV